MNAFTIRALALGLFGFIFGIGAKSDPQKKIRAMNSIFTLLLVTMFSAPLSCHAFEEKNILSAGDWSEPVAGAQDKNTTRGAHRPIIRGRLLLCKSPKNEQPAVYLELQDCGDVWGSTKEIYCDMNSGLTFDLRDMKGEPVPMKPFAFSGGTPGANWMALPCDSTVRLRISPYASFTPASSDDYMISGTFVVDPPADRTGLDVWQGKLKLPAMKIVVTKTIPKADDGADPLKSSSNPTSPTDVDKPTPPPPPPVSADGQKAPLFFHFFTSGIGESRQHLKTLTTKIVMGEDFDVRVDDGLESISGRLENRDGKIVAQLRSHYASCSYNYDGIIEMEKKYDAGNGTAAMSSILFISNFVVSTHADSKLFAAIQAEKTDFQKQMKVVSPAATSAKVLVSPEAQAVLDGLNQKAADPAWQSAIDMIERPETRTPNKKDSGEVTAFLSGSKQDLIKLGVRISWNATSRRYEVIAEVKTVDLGRVEMVDGSPSTFNLGGGRSCTITPTIGFSAINSYDLVLLNDTEKLSAPRQTAVVGQPVHISVGQTEVIFVPDVAKAPTKVADQIGTLVERLSKSHTWNNGAFPKLDTPKDASAKDVIAAYCKMSSFQDGSRISEFTVLEERTVKISGPLPDAYIAAKCKTDHGPIIFLLQYQEKPGQWWVKQYDAPTEQDAALKAP